MWTIFTRNTWKPRSNLSYKIYNERVPTSKYLHKVSYIWVAGQWRDNNEVPCHSFNAIPHPPMWSTMDQHWYGIYFDSKWNCRMWWINYGQAYITVWYCWSCARCEGSYPCSQKFATNTMTLCERVLSLCSTHPQEGREHHAAKTCWMRNCWFLQQTRFSVSHAGCICTDLHQ